jgi:hypothetical protein
VADEFDRVHSVHRALSVGALHDIIPPANLRPYLVHAIERAIGSAEVVEPEKMKAKTAGAMNSAA